jgi:hypothetical protein
MRSATAGRSGSAAIAAVLFTLGFGCGSSGTGPSVDAGSTVDSGSTPDAGPTDAGPTGDGGATRDAGSGADAGPGDGGSGKADSGYRFIPRSDWPLISNPGGHPVNPDVQLVTITFAGYPFQAEVEAFGDYLVGSSWFADTGREYGAGTGSHIAKLHLPDYDASKPQTISDLDIESLVLRDIDAGVLPPPGSPIRSLYMFYLPASITVSNGGFGASCKNFLGYHNEYSFSLLNPADNFNYAIVADCSPGQANELMQIETTASHELAEAATDPFPISAPAFQIHDLNSPWVIAGQIVEAGDVCEGQYMLAPGSDGGFWVQQIWSNLAADAGLAPCVPADPQRPYFGVTVSPAGTVPADAGETMDLQVTGWSSGPMSGSWSVGDSIWSTSGLGQYIPTLTWASPNLDNGESATLGVTVPAGAAAGSNGIVMLYSDLPNSQIYSRWPVVVRRR